MGSKIPKENMIPLGQPGNEEHDKEVREKLKGTTSQRREIAQQVRRTKEKIQDGRVNLDDITELISNPNASAKQIQEMIKEASKMDLKPGEFIQLIRTAIEKHKAIFGNKVQLNANIDLSIKDLQLQVTSVKRAVFSLFAEAKMVRMYEWQKKFSPEQCDAMLKHMEEQFNEKAVETKAKQVYMLHKAVAVIREKKVSINDIDLKDLEEANQVGFKLEKPEDSFDSAENMQRIKAEIDEKLEKEKQEKKQIVVTNDKQEEVVEEQEEEVEQVVEQEDEWEDI